MQPNFSNMSFRNSKRELFQKRDERFNRIRKIHEKMETETTQ